MIRYIFFLIEILEPVPTKPSTDTSYDFLANLKRIKDLKSKGVDILESDTDDSDETQFRKKMSKEATKKYDYVLNNMESTKKISDLDEGYVNLESSSDDSEDTKSINVQPKKYKNPQKQEGILNNSSEQSEVLLPIEEKLGTSLHECL